MCLRLFVCICFLVYFFVFCDIEKVFDDFIFIDDEMSKVIEWEI